MAVDDQAAQKVEPPTAPRTVDETGLDIGLLVQLFLKTLYFSANLSEGAIAERIGLSLSATAEVIQFLRREQLCESTGAAGASLTTSRFALTSGGLERAETALAKSGYVGPAPVPLADYVKQVQRQSIYDVVFRREDIESGLAHLVLPVETRELIGQAITAKRATLFYGASGDGKTSAAVGMKNALPGQILIPHAIEVMHEIVQVYDHSAHDLVERPVEREGLRVSAQDRRWLVIQRPLVFGAGELANTHLDLILDDVQKTYEAPIQLKANGGLLVIDDFGRQRIDAAYLLNRWITPLERRIDHLSLHSGARFEVPFDTIPIFVSNRSPVDLADDAFLRRIRYKIKIPSPDRDRFLEILKRECKQSDISYDDGAANHLLETQFGEGGREMRGCHARDIVDAIADAARYQGLERSLTPNSIDRACSHYFA